MEENTKTKKTVDIPTDVYSESLNNAKLEHKTFTAYLIEALKQLNKKRRK